MGSEIGATANYVLFRDSINCAMETEASLEDTRRVRIVLRYWKAKAEESWRGRLK